MAKKSRFALIMRDGVEVRDMEALQENFSLEQVLLYLSDGKLVTWLRDRYLDDTADAVLALDREAADFHRRLCNIFEVEYMGNQEGDMEKEKERERKTILLKEYMAEERFYHVVDQVAFDQEDLYDLLDEGETTIYLCGDRFFIPLGKREIRYIGVNFPVAVISSKKEVDFGERGISFQDVRFDEKYAKVLSETGGRCDGIEEGKRGHACGQVSEITGIIQQFLDRASKDIGKCNPMHQFSEVMDFVMKLLAAVAKSVELETDGKPFLKDEEIGKEMAAGKETGCPGQADVPVLAAGYPEKALGQIKHLAADLNECIDMFMTRIPEKYKWKKIIYNNTFSLYASYYDSENYKFKTKAEAKMACQRVLKDFIISVCDDYMCGRDGVAEECGEFISSVRNDVMLFTEEFRDSFRDFISLDCDGEAEKYARDKMAVIADKQKMMKIYGDLNFAARFEAAMEELLNTPVNSLLDSGKWFEMCGYDYDNGSYCYFIDKAVDSLIREVKGFFADGCKRLEDRMHSVCREILEEYCGYLKGSLREYEIVE